MAVALLAASLAGPALVGCSGGDDAAAARSTTTTATVSGTPGGRGAGDPYFPDLGNGGYDVEHYDLALTWHPDAGTLDGVATITATATQDLSRFDLDLSGLEVAATTVDGKPATTSRDAAELIVTPSRSIGDGHRFEVVVTYGGRSEPIHQGTDLFRVGWQTEGREAFVASEPAGAATFFPGNDHPSDKATYTFHITAPKDQVVATNGEPLGQRTLADGSVTWDSTARDPIATYLVQVAIGDYEVVDGGTSTAGVPIRHVLHRDLAAEARDTVSRTAQMMDVMSGIWGPYPFETYGVLAVDTPLDFALETQTLTLIGSDIAREGRDAEVILVHELAHQWVGDAVSPATWKDIWLNEGFATYSEWLWSERTGGLSAAQLARRTQAEPGLDGPTADPGADELFQRTVYDRGALTLQALREEVGDDAFFRVLRTWVDEHGGRSASTADFTALAARVSGRDLAALFDRWLQQPAVPSLP